MAPKGKSGAKAGKGRGHSGAFSGAKKKELLQSRRAKKRGTDLSSSGSDEDGDEAGHGSAVAGSCKSDGAGMPVVITSFGGRVDGDEARLSSMFAREDDEVVAARRKRGSEPLDSQGEGRRPLVAEPFVPFAPSGAAESGPPSSAGSWLPHPTRPDWPEGISAQKLEQQEEAYFDEWCRSTLSRIETSGGAGRNVAPFELNLEVWRQLWRVLEQSDVVVLIADVRNPTFHIPPSLVHEVVVRQSKRLVIALSKCDLVSQAFVRRWQHYLSRVLPGVGVVEFSSRPAGDLPGGERGAGGVTARRRWLGRRCRHADVEAHLYSMAKSILASVLLSQHSEEGQTEGGVQASAQALSTDVDEPEEAESTEPEAEEAEAAVERRADEKEHAEAEAGTAADLERETEAKADVGVHLPQPAGLGRGPGGALAIGLVGHPNVGKTSVLNALAGRKAASVSATAGHTKHLQHIRVEESLHPNAYVIDCPGLVFPSLHTRAHAELNGLLPLAQTRETLSAVRILAEALPLPSMFALKMPDWYEDESDDPPWTPFALCEAYAEKNKYQLPRSGAPDVHRGGLEIVKDGKDGSLLLAYEPPSLCGVDSPEQPPVS